MFCLHVRGAIDTIAHNSLVCSIYLSSLQNTTNVALQSYDIVSVASSNEKLFHACCSHESVDIVVIEAARKLPFYLKKPQTKSVETVILERGERHTPAAMQQRVCTSMICLLTSLLLSTPCPLSLAIERGIHFEFSFVSSLRDASSRRYLFSNLLSLLRLTRGRNLILSSGASTAMELRGPWDVINLAVLAGVDPPAAKQSIAAHGRSVLLHAEARKTMKCVLREVKLDEPTAAASSSSASSSQHHPKPLHKDEDTKHKDKRAKFNNNKQ